MRIRQIGAAAILGLLALAATARGDLFDITVNGTSDTAHVKGSSVPDLVDDLLNTKGKFDTFNGQGYSASLNYGGVKDAITLGSNADGTNVVLRIPSTGLNKTFTGTSRDDVQNQIKDFLLKDGSSEYAKFIQEINKQSLLGIVDGNPHATTAMMSDHAFRTFGLNRSPARLDAETPASSSIASSFRLDFEGGVADNDEVNESFFTGAIDGGIVGDRFGVTFSTLFNYRDLDGSSAFSVGEELGLPIQIIRAPGNGLSWQITPTAIIAGGASYDLAAGGTMWGVGATSALDLRLGDFIFTLADQIAYYKGFSIDIGEYNFDTNVDQTILKNGVGVAYVLGRSYVDASLSYTNFLSDAAVDNYFTPSIGFGWKFGAASGIHVAYKGDFGDNYSSNGGEVTLYFGF